MEYKARGKTFAPTSEKRNYIQMCNNCNCGCNGLFNLLFGTSRNCCGCNNNCGNNRNGCGCNNNCGCQNNNNCGCFDAYYAAQYGLNTNCCGCSDWFTCQQEYGCNSCGNNRSVNNRSGCGCNSCSNNRSGCGCNNCCNSCNNGCGCN